jgi:hypothetical protein
MALFGAIYNLCNLLVFHGHGRRPRCYERGPMHTLEGSGIGDNGGSGTLEPGSIQYTNLNPSKIYHTGIVHIYASSFLYKLDLQKTPLTPLQSPDGVK